MAEVVIVRDAEEGGEIAAGILAAAVEARPDAVLGLATGSTPLTTWQALARHGLDLSRVRGFALDEYVGLAAGHPESYAAVVRRDIVAPLGMDPALVRVPGDDLPEGADLRTAGPRYEDAIAAAGGVDVQVLGIGTTGHIGFNEPGSSLASRPRIKPLTEQTRRDNARFFPSLEAVPRHCLTQGLGTIRDARALVLLAWGAGKAEAVAGAVEGPVTAACPGSAIQLHPEVTVVVDEGAASRLRFADYYRHAWENRHLVS